MVKVDQPTEAEIVYIVERAISAEKNPNALRGMSVSEAQNHYVLVARVLPHVPDSHKYLVMAYKVRIQREYHLDEYGEAQAANSIFVEFSDAELEELRSLIVFKGIISDQVRANEIVEWAHRVRPQGMPEEIVITMGRTHTNSLLPEGDPSRKLKGWRYFFDRSGPGSAIAKTEPIYEDDLPEA